MEIRKNRRGSLKFIITIAIFISVVVLGFSGSLSAGSGQAYKDLKLFTDVLGIVEDNYVDEVDTKEMMEKAINGMLKGLDPHSALLPPEALKDLQADTKGKFEGLGIVITIQEGALTVIAPINGTPAYNAGIKAGDIIAKINDESTSGMELWKAVRKMRGPKGSKVTITIKRKDVDPKDYTIVRGVIPMRSVKAMSLEREYGYIWITNFRSNTTEKVRGALKKLLKNGRLKGLVLDLRDNPGGTLEDAIKISDLFLDSGVIVSIKGRNQKKPRVYKARSGNSQNYPIVALINGGSASAAEIVAGALQDNRRATILGTTSFGKGSVQTLERLREGYGLKLTIARYYTPSGKSIQAKGIKPDIVLPYQLIDQKNILSQENDFPKEKDLKNHLKAAEEKKGDKTKSKKQKHDAQSKHSPLELKKLMSDNQVLHALNILKAYQILK